MQYFDKLEYGWGMGSINVFEMVASNIDIEDDESPRYTLRRINCISFN